MYYNSPARIDTIAYNFPYTLHEYNVKHIQDETLWD